MSLTRRDIVDTPVFDTPLHPAIQLSDYHQPETDELVIYNPDEHKADQWAKSPNYVDTYDKR